MLLLTCASFFLVYAEAVERVEVMRVDMGETE